jgi:hypothetical protein
MIHRWPPNDAADGSRYGPDPKAPIRTQRRSLAQITITSRDTRISSSYQGPGAGGFAPTSSKNAGAKACDQAPPGHPH